MFDWAMSVSAGHIACPVDLEGLYAAREFDFVHDVAGINKNLNHLTGNLDNSFIPRYAIKNRKGGRLGKQYHYQCLSNR